MSERPSVLRGIGVLGAGQAVGMACSMMTAALLGRAIGPEGYGILGFGTALLAFFCIVATLGTDTLGSREIARAPDRSGDILGNILAFRSVLLLVLCPAFVALCFWLDRTPLQREVLLIQGAGIVVTALTLDFLFQGLHRMTLIAGRQIVASVLTVVGVFVFIHRPEDVPVAAMVTVAAGGISALVVLPAVWRAVGGFRLTYSVRAWRRSLAPALPLALTGAMITVLYNTDAVMLGLMVPAHEVGLYAASFRILMVAMVPAGIILAIYHPRLSEAFGDPVAMRKVAGDYFIASTFVGPPVTVAGMCLAEPSIRFLFGPSFLDGAPILVVLMVSGFLAYMQMLVGPPLLAWNAEKVHLKVNLAGAAANILLNLLLIPRYGPLGAACASVMTQAGIVTGFWFFLRAKVDGLAFGPVLRLLICVAIAGAAGFAFVRLYPLGDVGEAAGALILLGQGGVTIAAVYLLACRLLGVRWLEAVTEGRGLS